MRKGVRTELAALEPSTEVPAATVPGNVLTCELVPSVPVWVTPVMLKFAPAAVVAPVPPQGMPVGLPQEDGSALFELLPENGP